MYLYVGQDLRCRRASCVNLLFLFQCCADSINDKHHQCFHSNWLVSSMLTMLKAVAALLVIFSVFYSVRGQCSDASAWQVIIIIINSSSRAIFDIIWSLMWQLSGRCNRRCCGGKRGGAEGHRVARTGSIDILLTIRIGFIIIKIPAPSKITVQNKCHTGCPKKNGA